MDLYKFKVLILNKIGNFNRELWKNKRDSKKIKNKNFTIISQTCIGGLMYHDTMSKFLSPTINVSIEPKYFIKLLENMKYYMSIDKIEEVKTDKKYPVGKLDDIIINFVHYSNFEDAVSKWNERKKRINYDKLFIVMAERDGCSEEIIKRFENLPYDNKIIFTTKKYKYNSCVYVNYPDPYKDQIGLVTNMSNIFGKRVYEKYFDYIGWLNNKYENIKEFFKV